MYNLTETSTNLQKNSKISKGVHVKIKESKVTMIKYLFLHTVELFLDLHAARSVDLNIAARQDHRQPPTTPL